MTQSLSRWHITPNASNDQAYPILSQDPVWNSFALADLEPPLRNYSQFAMASQDESNAHAICLILRHPIIGQVLSPFGREEGVAAILKHVSLPEYPLIQAQEIHIPLLQNYYQPETTWKSMVRMAITSNSLSSLSPVPHRPVKQLTVSDIPALKKLYAQHPELDFVHFQLKTGSIEKPIEHGTWEQSNSRIMGGGCIALQFPDMESHGSQNIMEGCC